MVKQVKVLIKIFVKKWDIGLFSGKVNPTIEHKISPISPIKLTISKIE